MLKVSSRLQLTLALAKELAWARNLPSHTEKKSNSITLRTQRWQWFLLCLGSRSPQITQTHQTHQTHQTYQISDSHFLVAGLLTAVFLTAVFLAAGRAGLLFINLSFVKLNLYHIVKTKPRCLAKVDAPRFVITANKPNQISFECEKAQAVRDHTWIWLSKLTLK